MLARASFNKNSERARTKAHGAGIAALAVSIGLALTIVVSLNNDGFRCHVSATIITWQGRVCCLVVSRYKDTVD